MKKITISIGLAIIYFLFTFLISGVANAQGHPDAEENAFEDAYPPALNESESAQEELEKKAQGLDEAIPEEAAEILDGISASDITDGSGGLSKIWDALKENGLGFFKAALKSGLMMLTIILLCSLASSVMSEGGPKDAVSLGGAVGVSAVAVSNVNSFIGLGISTLNTLSTFSKVILPSLCTAAVSAGAYTSASAKYAATAMFMDLLISLGANIIMPLISAYIAAVIAGAALGKETLTRLADMLKWVCTAALTLLVLAFTAYLSITGIISGKADELATKAAKSALSTLLPVVGDVISNAAETLVSGAGIIRNSIGVFGMLVIIASCLFPILRLGAHYLVYKGTAALSEALTDKRLAQLIDGVGTAFGLVLGLVGAAAIMLFISLYSMMRTVGAA